jgi:hypothetical protein
MAIDMAKRISLKNNIPTITQQNILQGISISSHNLQREKKTLEHNIQRVSA